MEKTIERISLADLDELRELSIKTYRETFSHLCAPADMEEYLARAYDRGKAFVWLGVWEKNSTAIRFYEKHGFSVAGTHEFRMGEDVQTDYIMRRDLP